MRIIVTEWTKILKVSLQNVKKFIFICYYKKNVLILSQNIKHQKNIIMKKLFIAAVAAVLSIGNAAAQSDFNRGLANHWGLGVGAGTEGINVSVATCLTNYVEMELGMNFMPGIKVHGDVDATYNYNFNGVGMSQDDQIRVEGKFARTTVDFKAHVYPFGGDSKFFVAAGFSMGGADIAELYGHSDVVAELYKQQGVTGFDPSLEIDKYKIEIDKNGNASGGIKVNSFRPYLGLGFGRLIPKHRLGARVELGVQFHGKPKVYSGDNDNLLESFSGEKASDDISDIVDKLTVYPVLKFSLRGRLF